MRHRVKKIKFKSGQDATSMLVRKLVQNFIKFGKLTTTHKRGKVVKSVVERLVSKAKSKKEKIDVSKLNATGGYVRLVRMRKRESDGADMVQVNWVSPVVDYKKKIDQK